MRNDLTIYNQIADQWWSDEIRWVRILKNLASGRLGWFDQALDWRGKDVLDLVVMIIGVGAAQLELAEDAAEAELGRIGDVALPVEQLAQPGHLVDVGRRADDLGVLGLLLRM